MFYHSYSNYKGGINNLLVVRDEFGNIATSFKDFKTAENNLKTRLKRQKGNKNGRL